MTTTLRTTIADLELLPPPLDDTRHELINGVLFVSTQPHAEHQRATLALGAALFQWSRQSGLGECLPAPGVIFSTDEAVAPDLVWLSQARLAQALGADGKLHKAPEIVVEVLSPGAENERRDREVKLELYSRHGIDEYWLVDWRGRFVELYPRGSTGLALTATLRGADVITSPLLPSFTCLVSDLWR